ncbi:N-acetyltransferase [Kribbella antibiotica]|uniref:N-acetyltransferase n=1 Tax=Kribbella antibiotica TaxID=190195 RepID=A0A4R4ZRX0_9ACTN|nr:GNAT family N-acetyltransferase [Kribbella antibiotica]TDD61743.1 N-acetyltransferase [Kribbella antibiotica]
MDLATVIAANDKWMGPAPEGSEVVETDEYRLVRLPDRFPDPLQVQWIRSARSADAVLNNIVQRASAYGLSELQVYEKLGSPEGLAEALLKRGAECYDTADVLALALPAELEASELEARWVAELEDVRDANIIASTVFGGPRASDEDLASRLAAYRKQSEAGAGGILVGYVDGVPAGISGLDLVDSVARIWGGAVLDEFRGHGIYRALTAKRLQYAAEHGATMALTQGRISTSSPILKRVGFTSYGQQRSYRLPLEGR